MHLEFTGGLLVLAFQVWMIVDCIQAKESGVWILVILLLPILGSLVYLFVVKLPRPEGHDRR